MIDLHNVDCLEFMRGMDANSVDAIVTDPPYFGVKEDDWDNQWKNADHFIEWIGELSEQWQRILKPNGSLYCFASPRMAARVEVTLSARFEILQNIVWNKDTAGRGQAAEKEAFRNWWPGSERIIFAEHYGADNIAKGEAGYIAKCDELRGFVFEPLRAYLAGEW
jgi:adenine-specific DNA-methyltransferase